jgi:Putative zinc-finger
MQCKDMDELISAYSDGELSYTQKQFVEEHMAGCPDCRDTLAKYSKIRQDIWNLRQTPAMKDLKSRILAKARARNTTRRMKNWLPPAAVRISTVGIVLAAILIGFFGRSGGGEPVDFWAKVAAATEQINEFKMTIYGNLSVVIAEVVYNAPSTYYTKSYDVTYSSSGGSLTTSTITDVHESITIGYDQYAKESENGAAPRVSANPITSLSPRIMTTKSEILALIGSFDKVTQLDDELKDGVMCSHYLCEGNSLDSVQKFVDALDPQDPYYPQALQALEEVKQGGQNIPMLQEFWVGKSDYLIRQVQADNSSGNPGPVWSYTYKDTGEIPQVVQSGIPVPGWYKVTHISLDSSFTVEPQTDNTALDYYFLVELHNTSQQTLTNVKTYVYMRELPNQPQPSMTLIETGNPEDTTFDPGEKLQYFGHNFSNWSTNLPDIPGMSPYPPVVIEYTDANGINCVQALVFN